MEKLFIRFFFFLNI
uniref:Uncharacterized protein n=1 Tax=Rhizophora mucronata TaxID=61149 RepID=A0A2P2NPI7_RHIMU